MGQGISTIAKVVCGLEKACVNATYLLQDCLAKIVKLTALGVKGYIGLKYTTEGSKHPPNTGAALGIATGDG